MLGANGINWGLKMGKTSKFTITLQTIDDTEKICLILLNNETGKVPAFMVFEPGLTWDDIQRRIKIWGSMGLYDKDQEDSLIQQAERIFIQRSTSLN